MMFIDYSMSFPLKPPFIGDVQLLIFPWKPYENRHSHQGFPVTPWLHRTPPDSSARMVSTFSGRSPKAQDSASIPWISSCTSRDLGSRLLCGSLVEHECTKKCTCLWDGWFFWNLTGQRKYPNPILTQKIEKDVSGYNPSRLCSANFPATHGAADCMHILHRGCSYCLPLHLQKDWAQRSRSPPVQFFGHRAPPDVDIPLHPERASAGPPQCIPWGGNPSAWPHRRLHQWRYVIWPSSRPKFQHVAPSNSDVLLNLPAQLAAGSDRGQTQARRPKNLKWWTELFSRKNLLNSFGWRKKMVSETCSHVLMANTFCVAAHLKKKKPFSDNELSGLAKCSTWRLKLSCTAPGSRRATCAA